MVERIDNESTTTDGELHTASIGRNRWALHETSGQEDDGVDQTNDPFISPFAGETEFFVEGEIGAVCTSLIPTLGGSSYGTETDGIPQHTRAMPLVVLFVPESSALFVGELLDELESIVVTGNEGSASEEVSVLGHAMSLGKGTAIGEGISWSTALSHISTTRKRGRERERE